MGGREEGEKGVIRDTRNNKESLNSGFVPGTVIDVAHICLIYSSQYPSEVLLLLIISQRKKMRLREVK